MTTAIPTSRRRLPQEITLAWLRRHGACDGWHKTFQALFPRGAPLTREAAFKAHDAGLDVLWVGIALLTADERREFIVFTLKQRQPHLVSLFREAHLGGHAEAIAAIDWGNLSDAKVVLTAARNAAWDGAWAAAWAADAARAARDAAWDAASDAAWDAAAWAAGGARHAFTKQQIHWIADALGLEGERDSA